MSEQEPGNPHNQELEKRQPVIVVDIDGVLFDTPKQAVERWNKIHGTDYKVEKIFDHNAKHNKDRGIGRKYHKYGSELDPATGERFDDIFYGAQKDIAGYLLMPGACEVLLRLKKEYGASIHALTARDKNNLGGVTLTALAEHFGIGPDDEGVIDELHFSGDPDFIGESKADKGTILRDKLGGDIMVEDSIANAKSAQRANVATFVLRRAYNDNENHDWPQDQTAIDWNELYNLISESLERQGYRKITE